ncbi:MAG: glyoxylate/hydroxypyruvate reductase A [Saprospiraceae bacterium]|jgi:glyoxylate/hydroxypyruvate reductase A
MIVFLDKKDNIELWLNSLKSALPNTIIEAFPNVENREEVAFAICMRPTKEQVEQFPNLKVIQCLGAGVNYILEANVLTEKMILTRTVDPGLSIDMFEFTLSIVLSEIKNLPKYARQQPQKIWRKLPYKRFEETTIGILGLGEIGSYVAERFAALGFQVKGWSNSRKVLKNVESFAGKAELPNCLSKVDFLINILPLTPATNQILNRANLQHLPKGSFLINVGRGTHNHETDIIDLLNEEHLSGALLDVFQQEPLPNNHPFWEHPKVKITPHIASMTNPVSASKLIAENYKRFKQGLPLNHVVDLGKGY